MGQHYIPRFYLNGFTKDREIWVYDKKSKQKFPSQPKTVGNENKIYPDEVEKFFANYVEDPAKSAIEHIRSHEMIPENLREPFSQYVMTLWKRVPKARERVKNIIPKVANEVEEQTLAEIDRIINDNPEFADMGEKRKAEINQIINKYESERPDSIWQQSLIQNVYQDSMQALLKMNWCFFYVKEKEFLTCDNPVFFFEHEGISSKSSELTLPISSNVVFWANNLQPQPKLFIKAKSQVIKEINRRSAYNASRFVFFHSDEQWILPFISKNNHRLTRLR